MGKESTEAGRIVGITDERRESERRAWRFAFVGSVVLHVLVFVLWPAAQLFMSPFAAAGPRNGDDRAAAGGMQAMTIQAPTPRPITPPQIPLPVTDPIPIEIQEEEVTIETASILGERPGDEGPGREEGTGQGDGGTADEGLFRLMPPSPRGMIIPPSDPSLRGKRVEVWVFVDERGRVVADSTALRPPTDNGDLNRRLIREASEWIFEPARKGGQPVAAWFPYTISTGGL